MTDPFVVKEINMPVDRVHAHVEAILRMIVLLVAVQHLIIITLNLVDSEDLRVAFDLVSVWVLGH